MSTAVASEVTPIPTGTWTIEPVHSSIGFSARHMVVHTFRGAFDAFSGRIASDESGTRIEGVAPVASVSTRDPNLTAHLASPDFFDAERHPELHFASTNVVRDGERVVVTGDVTLRGITRPITLTGQVAGPVEDPYGGIRLGLELTGTIDRRDFGIVWNAPLPAGGLALGNEVTLDIQVELVKEA